MNKETSSQSTSRSGPADRETNAAPVEIVENGAWCWYQDERAIVDRTNGNLVIASTANRDGHRGAERDGDIDVTFFHPESGRRETFTVHRGLTSYGAGDDHNVPALWQRPDGGIVAMYAGHNNEPVSRYRIRREGRWGPEQEFDWTAIPGGCNFPATYSNLFYLSAEDTLYNFARVNDRSPNLMLSSDHGSTWRYGGQLTRPEGDVGYVNGYFIYAGNGVDRIDFIATEHHPRDFNTSLYHGFVRGGKRHDAQGTVLGGTLLDRETAPHVHEFTPVFRAGTEVEGAVMTRAWNLAFRHYPDGRLALLFQTRADDSDQDHRFFHALFENGEWTWQYLAKAGPKIIPHEEDYTGGGALHPEDPFRLCISTPIDPRGGEDLGRHELFSGRRTASGWEWTPVTANSPRGNFRPILVPRPDHPPALLWWRGIYHASQNYDASVVGLFEGI